MSKKTVVRLFIECFVLIGVGAFAFKISQPDREFNPTVSIPRPEIHKIAAAGDIACNPTGPNASGSNAEVCQDRATAELIKNINPEAVLALGDLQYDKGEYANFLTSFNASWGSFKQKIYPAPGNHDYDLGNLTGFNKYFTGQPTRTSPTYYSFDVGKWHIISLDSNCGNVGGCDANSIQGKWLKQDLAASQKACTLAFWHHPKFTSGRHNASSETDRSAYFWQALYDAKADVILNGHDHLYERFGKQSPTQVPDLKGLQQLTVGTGGKSLYQKTTPAANSEVVVDSAFGILKLNLYPKAYSWEFVSTGNKVLDSGRNSCTI